MRLRNTARTLRNEVAQIGFDAARQPDTARTAFTDHIARRQRASMQHSLSAKPCGETPRVAEHHSTQPYTPAAKPFRIMEHAHHSVTSIPGSALSLQGGWSLRLRRNACRPVILTQCVQRGTIAGTHASDYALRLLRAPVFTHLYTNERRPTQPLCRAVWRNLTATVFLLSLLVLSGFVGFSHD